MAVKNFIINPSIQSLSKEEVSTIEDNKLSVADKIWTNRELLVEEEFKKQCTLNHTFGRVVVRVNTESKNYHTFQNGVTIRRERNFNEFNRRVTQPSNAEVVSGEGIPVGSEILINHNSTHDTNRIYGYKSISPDVKYFSIPEYDCFAWRNGDGGFNPMKHFDFALRVFKPYTGHLVGLPHHEYKDILYVTTGELKGSVVQTLKGCDYTIVYQEKNGREGNLIRFRPFGNPIEKREEEAIAVLNDFTDKVNSGELLVGVDIKDCKKINEYYG